MCVGNRGFDSIEFVVLENIRGKETKKGAMRP